MPRPARLVLPALFACALAFAASAAEPIALPKTWTVEQFTKFSEKGWEAPGKDGDRAFRAAARGAWFRVPSWWGDGTRPPKGEIYVIEVTYKDDFKVPVVVNAQGGNGHYEDRSELHRIGGLNDGQWKTANVPASWDLLFTPKDTHDVEVGFSMDKEAAPVAIAQITVRQAKLPEDRVRYEAECREWVQRVQAEAAKTAAFMSKDQTLELPENLKAAAIVPYIRPYYAQIHPNSAPQKGETGVPLKLQLAQNEFEPAAFGVYAQEDLADVTYSVSPLKGDAGELDAKLQLMTCEYALQTKARRDESNLWSAQRLWPAFPTNIAKGRSGWFYLLVQTLGKDKSKPGTYKGTITVTAGKHTAELPLEVTVLPFEIQSMDEAGLFMGGCCTGLPTPGEMKTFLEHNHNVVNIWFAGVQPGMKKVGDKIELDFYYLDEWMARAKEAGMKRMVWFLGGNPNGYPNTISIERDLYKVMHDGDKETWPQKQGTPEQRGKIQDEVRPHYVRWVKEVVAHAKEKGWPELVFTPFDEPAKWAYPEPRADKAKYAIGCGPWIRDHFKAACALLHEAAPENKVYVSMHRNFYREVHGTKGRVGEIFIPDVDLVCSNAIDEDHELGQKVLKEGKEWWQYGMPYSRRYGYGFFFASWESTGSLCWAYNWAPRLDVSNAPKWVYGWYSPFETILTPEYQDIREAWDDRRYLATARALAKQKNVDLTEFWNAMKKEIQANEFKGGGGRDLVNDFWTTNKDPLKMDEWRQQLADKIQELMKK